MMTVFKFHVYLLHHIVTFSILWSKKHI